jgi:hypothetical protein
MKKSTYIDFGADGVKITADPDAAPGQSTKSQRESAWDVVIRAHYLAHEMRHYCMTDELPMPEVTRLAAAALETWATRFGAELEKGAGVKEKKT